MTFLPESTSDDCTSSGAEIAGVSDIGRRRKVNQDHFLIADLHRTLTIRSSNVPHDECEQLTGREPGLLLVVADGMGGHSGGEVASTTAIQSAARYVLDMMHWFLKLSNDKEEDFIDELSDCLKNVQEAIWSKSVPDAAGRMGTTVTMAYIIGSKLYIVHAGDSRAYLFRDGQLKQLTTDHTMAQRLVEDGALSQEDAETSRWRHVLWNCVGGCDNVVQPEVTKVNLREHDALLLCSDGLTGMVPDDEIVDVLSDQTSCREKAEALVQKANAAGGNDNITVVVGNSLIDSRSDKGLRDTDAF
tara:strand:- start:98393 stop:99298 length:906 start_codon:yes stop_codon:yes gene_type:complete